MKKAYVFIHAIFLATLVITSCSQVQPTATFEPTTTSYPIRSSTPTFTQTVTPTTTPLPTKTPEPTITLTPTFFPLFPVVKEWSTYTFPFGDVRVSIQYPADWRVNLNSYPYGDTAITFRLDSQIERSRNYGISLSIENLPIADRHFTDPHTWEPNEGGLKVIWEKQLKVDDLTGIEFIWGSDKLGSLYGNLYSQEYELDLRLNGTFDHIDEKDVIEIGYDKIIQEHFYVFEHMLQSIRVQNK
jgi:hypothetical protein